MNKLLAAVLTAGVAALLGGCSEEGAEAPPPARAPMLAISAAELPNGINEDCGCVRDGQCVVLDERLGSLEVRNLRCRWLQPGATAECRFDERFVPLYPRPDGNFVEAPEAWHPRRLRAIYLPNGLWCSG